MSDSPARTLFVSRPLENAEDLLAWADEQGIPGLVPADQMHVTIAYSRVAVDWFTIGGSEDEMLVVPSGGPRELACLGPRQDTCVLRFNCDDLEERWEDILEDSGASWDWGCYKPHVTLSTSIPGDLDVSAITPYQGPLVFGPERFEELRASTTGLAPEDGAVTLIGKVVKLDGEQRIAYGWFSVVEENGQPVVDQQGDYISEAVLTKAVHDFNMNGRAGKVLHNGRRVADIVESVMLSRDVQQALGVDLGRTGWFGAMQYNDQAAWERVKSGELPAFSIGGFGARREM